MKLDASRIVRPGTPLESAWTLPASWYFDPEHHAAEIERVFRRTWQAVGRTTQVSQPGDYFTAEVAGEPLAIVRSEDGAIRAFHNVCRHRAGAVVRGEGCVPTLRCTYHGWTYALDGSLRSTPELDGIRDFEPADFGLRPVRCETWEQYLFVNLDPDAEPLAGMLGPLLGHVRPYRLARLTFEMRETYEIACNWKAYVDNYLEGYHIPRAHPRLHKLVDYKRYEVRAEGNTVVQVAPYRSTPAARAAARATTQARGATGLYLWFYPNFMLNLSDDYVQTNTVMPLGPERTLTIFDYYFDAARGRASEENVRTSRAWSDEIQQEDIRICESVQRNLHSRSYLAGRYSPRRENGLHHFHELLRAAMQGRPASRGGAKPRGGRPQPYLSRSRKTARTGRQTSSRAT